MSNKPEWAGKLVGEMFLNNVTQTELSKELGLSRAYVSMILRGVNTAKTAEQRFNNALKEIVRKRGC